ncbi:CRISPR-associated helicase Cas3' [Saccharolobus islandicus]|uniref:CRISPR-associated helicase Cas3' n=1 Tax=Saccharolobus islandicus TaxID=43080 RepID=UPI00241F6791|nr:CRISPR-associated helicase Cas3' [Sulfolobus islandicus]
MSEKESRIGLEKFEELINQERELIAVLPTGYGKTRFFIQKHDLLDKIGKIVHSLPLQAIIFDFYNEMKKVLKDNVGYQMSLHVPEDDGKRPYLSRKYMITTVDSFLLDFYGIPVHEIFRSKWHSDIAMLFARTSNIILDEFHLLTAIDVDNVEKEFAKVISVVSNVREAVKKRNRRFIILTATLPRSLIESFKIRPLVLAPDSHPFVTNEMIRVWDNNDGFISSFSEYGMRVKTYIHTGDKRDIIKRIVKDNEGRILIVLNHIKDVEELSKELEGCVFVHGLFTNESKQRIINDIRNFNCVISTQVLEAGVNLSFDVLITDIAPAFSLIQRAGRILRTPDDIKSKEGEIHILVDDLEKQVKGVYSVEITKATYDWLNENCGKCCRMNWRLPEKDKPDYLRLILAIDKSVNNIMQKEREDINNFLNFITNIIQTPQRIIGKIDELFNGSFIRSASLVPVILKNETASLNWSRFLSLINKKKEWDFSYLKITDDNIEERNIKISENKIYNDRPLTTMIRIIREIRRKEKVDDDLSGYITIIPKGFILPMEFIGIEKINGSEYLYVS